MSTPNGSGERPEVIGVRRGMFGAGGSGDTSGYGRLVRSVALPGSTPRPYGGYFDAVVDRLADQVAVLRDGALQEIGPRDAILRDPQTDYTRRLVAAVPVPDPAEQHRRRQAAAGLFD